MTTTYSLLGKNGALGNQLWQIAGAYGIARKSGEDPIFPHWAYQKYFSVPYQFFTSPAVVDLYHKNDLGSDYLQRINLWYPEHEAQVRRFFRPSVDAEGAIKTRFENEDLSKYAAVHVRRANNATSAYSTHHPPCPTAYFEEAMDKMEPPFVVFSDSMEWCKKQEMFKDALFAPGIPKGVNIMNLTKYDPTPLSEAALDLLAMAKCRKHIISNSTFSWWSAFLAKSEHVIYPERWFGEPLKHIDTDAMFTDLDWEKYPHNKEWDESF